MKKRILWMMIIALFVVGCSNQDQSTNQPSTNVKYEKFSASFFDTFDTLIEFISYNATEEDFHEQNEWVQSEFRRLHQLYDNYHSYEGINNIKTVNEQAGKEPVKVDKDLLELVLFAKKESEEVTDKTNIAMGSVLKIWHDYREAGLDDPGNAELPPMELLQEAAEHIDLDKVIVDSQASTIYIEDAQLQLDLGAVAKGYATELIAQSLMEKGAESAIISAGGNVRLIGKPLDGVRDFWGIGIRNPNFDVQDNEPQEAEILFINNTSIVTSGDYQRYYMVGQKRFHHLIDPVTLMPSDEFRSVTVVTENSAKADFLSTALFLMNYEEGKAFVEKLEGVEALWILDDEVIVTTEGLEKHLKSKGASGTLQ